MPKRKPTGVYLGPNKERLFIKALECYAAQTDTDLNDQIAANDWVAALENDTFLLETTEVPDAPGA